MPKAVNTTTGIGIGTKDLSLALSMTAGGAAKVYLKKGKERTELRQDYLYYFYLLSYIHAIYKDVLQLMDSF